MFLMNTQLPLWNQHLCAAFSLPPPPAFWTSQSVCIHWRKQNQPNKSKNYTQGQERSSCSWATWRKGRHVASSLPLVGLTYTRTCTQTFTFVNKGAWSSAKASLASGGLQIFVLTCGLDSWRDRHQGSSPRALFLREKQGQNRAVILPGVGKGLMSPLLARSLQKRTAVSRLISFTGYCERFAPDLLPKHQQPFYVLWCVSTVLVVERYSIYSE